jgi:hypothetical protein
VYFQVVRRSDGEVLSNYHTDIGCCGCEGSSGSSGSSTSSGSSASSGGSVIPPITTACCPDDPIPANLTLTISGVGGGAFPITYDAMEAVWKTGVISLTGAGAGTMNLAFVCSGSSWILGNVPGPADYTITIASDVTICDPFSHTTEGLLNGSGSYDGETRTFTVAA